ncbi:MAG: polysaccharide deacetylase family protein [Deltaproteobacteria bacterium]|nr:MAG: polysaccharide deacetylase family protein [Deltaproteobacteria bacterium]TMQ07544.1 MAG: polysaccharide deacetylase family protein [Deltaproteobacteria bacterium]
MSRVTLSFDNGPDPDVTPAVLDVLRDRGVAAQFYVLGKHLADPRRRRLVERARDEGHAIGNHSYSHGVPLGQDLRPDAALAEIAATEALLAPLVPGPKRFRPHGGGALGRHLLSPSAVAYLVDHGYSCILWNSVPRDWIDPEGWPARALADCATRPHTLLVLHDIPGASLAGLAGFIDAARGRGFELACDVPADCAPIVDGRITASLDGIVAPIA